MLEKHTEYIIHDFWSSNKYFQSAKIWNIGKAKVITALGMFYDLEDPNQSIGDIQNVYLRMEYLWHNLCA